MSYPVEPQYDQPETNQPDQYQQQYPQQRLQQPQYPPPQYPRQPAQPAYYSGGGPEQAMARMHSYEIAYVLILFLYGLFWLPGFIVNIVVMSEGRRMEKLAGQSLPGVGFLVVTFWINIILLILGVLFLLIILIAGVAAVPILEDLAHEF